MPRTTRTDNMDSRTTPVSGTQSAFIKPWWLATGDVAR
jgi:hypothetical protein